MRSEFDSQLETLNAVLVAMGALCENAIAHHAVNIAGWVIFSITGVREAEVK